MEPLKEVWQLSISHQEHLQVGKLNFLTDVSWFGVLTQVGPTHSSGNQLCASAQALIFGEITTPLGREPLGLIK